MSQCLQALNQRGSSKTQLGRYNSDHLNNVTKRLWNRILIRVCPFDGGTRATSEMHFKEMRETHCEGNGYDRYNKDIVVTFYC